jgi:hypothetical protein
MADNTTNKAEDTKPDTAKDQDRKHHEEPATPIKPASKEVKPVPANESTKNSK